MEEQKMDVATRLTWFDSKYTDRHKQTKAFKQKRIESIEATAGMDILTYLLMLEKAVRDAQGAEAEAFKQYHAEHDRLNMERESNKIVSELMEEEIADLKKQLAAYQIGAACETGEAAHVDHTAPTAPASPTASQTKADHRRPGRPGVPDAVKEKIPDMLLSGMSVRAVAAVLHISPAAVVKYKNGVI